MRLDLVARQAGAQCHGERLIIHPRWAAMLEYHGLSRPQDFLSLEGPIISGHPDRHVMRVTIGTGVYYLKREHRVPLRDRLWNWFAGFGPVSVSVREAKTLKELAAAGVAVPECVAAGEGGDGRAFLLLSDAGGVENLREYLAHRPGLDRRVRRRLARRLAALVARIHELGFNYPDLYAKHILVEEAGARFTLLDWQRSRRHIRLTWRQRCRDLAALNASLADELADADDRLSFLLAYWRAARDDSMSFASICARIQRRTQKLLRRSSIREQRLLTVAKSQPLYWVDGEALCFSETGRELLNPKRIRDLAYGAPGRNAERSLAIDGVRSGLTVRRTTRRFGRLLDALRGRRWQAPECRRAAELLREERLGRPRRLLAFGQRDVAWGCVDSFLLQTDHEAS
jgi:tRNA A-37 threonylcarbamoyl transferase component Bud32